MPRSSAAEISADANLLPTLLARGIGGFISLPNGREALPRPFVIDQTARRVRRLPSTAAPSGIPVNVLRQLRPSGPAVAGAGKTAAAGARRSRRRGFPALAPARRRSTSQLKSSRKAGTSPNVIGVIKGSDPALAAEAVAFSAHYDGFGVLRKAIYNGAADNAIGVGEMLAVAEAFARAKVKPRRSLVFIAFTAEEYGLLRLEALRGASHVGPREDRRRAEPRRHRHRDHGADDEHGGLRRAVQLARPDVLRGRARVSASRRWTTRSRRRECSAAPTTSRSSSGASPA